MNSVTWLAAVYQSYNNTAARNAGAFLPALCIIVFALAVVAFMLFVWSMIFRKAGYSPWMALLMIVPIANFVWLLVFAFSTWPIQRELEAYRSRGGFPPSGFPVVPPRQ